MTNTDPEDDSVILDALDHALWYLEICAHDGLGRKALKAAWVHGMCFVPVNSPLWMRLLVGA